MSVSLVHTSVYIHTDKYLWFNKMGSLKTATKVVRPLMSQDFADARRRALGLYRAFYRNIPYFATHYDVPKTEEEYKWKLREYYYNNSCITDVRIIDLLVLKGYMELKELVNNWQQKGHVMRHWNPSQECPPSDFLTKFFEGIN